MTALHILVTGSREWTNETIIRDSLEWAMQALAGARALADDGPSAEPPTYRLTHGDCMRGADRLAEAQFFGLLSVLGLQGSAKAVEADWEAPCGPECRPGHRRPYKLYNQETKRWRNGGTFCPVAGNYRNQVMVDEVAAAPVPKLCLAFPLPGSRGTWDCARRAHAAGIAVWVTEESGRRSRWPKR